MALVQNIEKKAHQDCIAVVPIVGNQRRAWTKLSIGFFSPSSVLPVVGVNRKMMSLHSYNKRRDGWLVADSDEVLLLYICWQI